jgi:SAM-dependent methyltransferase
MGARDRLTAGLARQLGRPEGLPGRLVGRMLDRGNRAVVSAAVEATEARPGQTVADLGFGGGLGLRLLLDRVAPTGHVHGVELSATMLHAAERRHRSALTQGRLTLQLGTLGDLPLDDRSLDALVTVNTLYFVADLPAAFGELARVLRGSGRAVVGVGDPTAMAALPVTRHGFRLRAVDDLVRGLQDAGLTVVRHGRVGQGQRAFHLLVAAPQDGAPQD